MIEEDIEKCKEDSSENKRYEIYRKYSTYIDGVKKLVPKYCNMKDYINVLEVFKAFGYKNKESIIAEDRSITLNTENKNVNVNKNTINIEITFNEVKEDIKSNEYLTDELINEIIGRIDELEKIQNEAGSAKSKWDKVKPIFSWLSTQGVNVLLKVLPLIMKVLSEG